MPSAIMYDALVRLSLKFAAILLSGNIALNKSPMLSTDRRLKLLTDTFASQKISAFMLSPGVINPRDCDEQAELSPDCFEKATSFFCFLSTLCLIASMCFFCLLCCNNWVFPALSHFTCTSQNWQYAWYSFCPFLHHSPILCPLLSTEQSQVSETLSVFVALLIYTQ